jgi:hypothetical protein
LQGNIPQDEKFEPTATTSTTWCRSASSFRRFRWFTDLMNIPAGRLQPGRAGQPPLDWAGQRIAPNICYEDLFGEELAALPR